MLEMGKCPARRNVLYRRAQMLGDWDLLVDVTRRGWGVKRFYGTGAKSA